MGIFNGLTEWTKNFFEPLGAGGLFILAFIESSFFPIPPDILLIVLSLSNPELSLFYAAICTIGSVTGGLFGYSIGYFGEHAILEKFIAKKKIEKVHNLFNKYEVWAIFLAGLTPIPYKVFTITAGVFYLNIKKFIIASFFGRGLRFFIIATLVMLYGQKIVDFIDKYFNLLGIVTLIIAVAGIFIYYKRKSRNKKEKLTSENEVQIQHE